MNRYCVQIDAPCAIPELLQFLSDDLRQGRHTGDELAELLLARGGDEQLPLLYFFLDELRKRTSLKYPVCADGALFATIEPLNGTFRLAEPAISAGRLSRFAYLRHNAGAILDCPETGAQIRLEAPAAVAFAEATVTGSVPPGPLGELLGRAGYLEPDQEGHDRAFWEFHDLLFHTSSRLGRPWHSIGSTWRFKNRLSAPPLLKDRMSNDTVPLPAFVLSDRLTEFNAVLESRRSIRTSKRTITLTQLAHLLYRVFRIKETTKEGSSETAHRTFPSGGGIHELECYAWIRDCDGLTPGLYHYRADAHVLCRLEAKEPQIAAALAFAQSGWGSGYPAPQVLLTLAARFPRIAVKYERMAYRAVLLNAGCAIQTVYLAATAMGLAVCGIGNGAPQIFAEATGLAPFEETSVAEIALSGEI